MELSHIQLERLISEVVLGGRLELVSKTDDTSILFFLKHPTRHDLALADYYKLQAEEYGKSQGLPTIEEMDKTLLSRGVWGPEKEEKIKSLENQIEAQEKVLAKTTRVPARRGRLKKVISGLKYQIFDIVKVREAYLDHTVERHAEEERLLYLCWSGVFNPSGKERYWDSLDSFKREKDILFRKNLSAKYAVFCLGIPTTKIRYLARSGEWMIRYTASQKKGGRLFNREVYDYSVDMVNLMYWSSFYASLHEMMPDERPPDYVIEDDDALDEFMSDYFKEKKREADESRVRKKSGKKTSAWDHNELIVTRNNPAFEDIEFSQTPAEKVRLKKGEAAPIDLHEKKDGRLR